MFTIDQNITVPSLREKNLEKVFFSMNNHEVATPEMMLEQARSYVMFCNEPDGKVSAYIGLYLLQTGRRLFYAHFSNPFSPGETGSVEDEALSFVEGLGAFVDEIDIAKLSPEEKIRWMDEQDILSLQARPVKPPEDLSPQPPADEALEEQPQAIEPPSAALEEATQPQKSPVQPEPQPVPAPEIQIAPPIEIELPVQPIAQIQHPSPAPPAPPQPAPPVQISPPTQETAQPRHAPEANPSLPASAPPPPVEKLTAEDEEESIPEPPAPQQFIEEEMNYEVQTVPPPADVPETRVEPKTRPASQGTSRAEAPVTTPERTKQKLAARAAAPRTASFPEYPAAKQVAPQKETRDDFVKSPKPPIKRGAEDDIRVVRRDREALARLLTSF